MKKVSVLALIFASFCCNVSAQTWENTNCSGTGVVYDLEESGNKLLVARANSGIISSTNGTNWTVENVGSTGSFRCIKQFDNVLYTATNASNIYTSSDNGTNWSLLGGASGLVSVYMTTFYKNSSTMIYGTNSGSASIYNSTNNGSTWGTSQFNYGSGLTNGFESANKNIVELSGTLYFSSLKDVFKSTDNGQTWNVISTAPEIPDGTVTSLSTLGNSLILTIYGHGTHKSNDGGLTWTMILGGASGTTTNNMTISYAKNGVLFVGGALGMVYVSTNGGANWTEMNIDGAEVVQCFKHFNGHIYAGTNMNLYRFEYQIGNVGLDENKINTLSVYPNPTSGIIHVENSENNQYEVFNIIGEKVLEGKVMNNQINIDNQVNGIYYIKINNNSFKIVKN
jgi:photosystem II stability/assembly factor-like uncharacterized protein